VSRARWVTALALVVALGGASISARALERLAPAAERAGQLLYLPNGKHLRIVSLGHSSLLADLIYLWAIQFYSEYNTTDRFRYVRHIFGDVIAELDPHYIDAYWLGAMILTIEARDLEGGLALLDLGIERNPGNWILPYLAAWECNMASNAECATRYFEQAAAVPGAPLVARRMHASMLARTGALDDALRLWVGVLEDPDSDDVSRAIARRKVREVRAEIERSALRDVIGAFRISNERLPRDLAELVRRGYIRQVPSDPSGQPYAYDATTGRITSAAGRVLGEP